MIDYIVHNSIFSTRANFLINPVNCVGAMGVGLAKQYALKYPEMLPAYREACQQGKLYPGALHVWDLNAIGAPRYVINFPTKVHYRQESTLDIIDIGLHTLASMFQENAFLKHTGRRIRMSLAIPMLGCGYGGLHWEEVRPLMEQYLGADNASVHVAVYIGNSGGTMAREVWGR